MSGTDVVSRWRLRVCLTLTALLSALGYAVAAEKPGMMLLALVVSALSLVLVRRQLGGGGRLVPRWVLNLMVLAAMVHLVLRFVLVLDDDAAITRLADFLTLVTLVKMLDRRRINDEMQLLGLACFVTIGALLTGQSLALGLALLLMMPMAITSAVLLQVHAGRDRAVGQAAAAGDARALPALNQAWEVGRTDRRAVVVALGCTLGACVLGGVVFAVAPRNLTQQLVAGALGQTAQSAGKQVGFSESIRLGESGLISQSSEVVLDATIKDQAGSRVAELAGPLYLRGSVLTTYDPKRGEWSAPAHDLSDPAFRPIEGLGGVRTGEASAGRVSRVVEITVRNPRAGSTSPMFAPYRAVQFRGPLSAGGPAGVRFMPGTGLAFADWRGGRMSYSVLAVSDYREAVPVPWPEQDASVFPPAVRELALRLAGEAGVPVESLGIEGEPGEVRRLASAISNHLRQEFGYTLEQVAPPAGVDPLEYFLTTIRGGHCEYFASAMTAMLQSLGVPARVITGYAAAEFNDISGHLVVRQSDAHAWVEVRLEPGRWETFDPTPPAQLQSARRASRSPWARARQAWEAIEFSWLDNVVAYESGIRLDVLANVQSRGEGLVRFQQRVDRAQQEIRRWLPDSVALGAAVVVFVLLVLIALGFVALRWGVRWLVRALVWFMGAVGARSPGWLGRLLTNWTRRGDGARVTTSTRFYADLLAELRRAGLEKPAWTPPLRHASKAVSASDATAGGAAADASMLYYQARFGGRELSAQEQAQGAGLVAQVRARLGGRGKKG